MGLDTDGSNYLVFVTLAEVITANQQIHANLVRKAAAEGWLLDKDTGAVIQPGDLPVDDALLQPMIYPLVGVKNGVAVGFPEGCCTGWDTPWQRATDSKYVIRKPNADLMTGVLGTIEAFDPSWEA